MIAIRRAGPPDVKDVLALRTKLYSESAQANGNGSLSATQQWRAFHDVLGFLLDPYSILLLAEDAGKPVGMLAIHAGTIMGFYSTEGITVTWVYIDPKYRDGQVLLQLVRTAEKSITAERPVTIQATIRADNRAMLAGSERLGYTPVALVVEKRMHGRASRRHAVQEVHEAGGRDTHGGAGRVAVGSELSAQS